MSLHLMSHNPKLRKHVPFLSSCVTVLTCDIDIEIFSDCPFLRHFPVLYRNGLTYRHSFFSMC